MLYIQPNSDNFFQISLQKYFTGTPFVIVKKLYI